MIGYKRWDAGQWVANWLFLGVGMLIIQIVLGGITRLTGSGLSITEWQPILGAFPPMSAKDWQVAFEKYKQIGQYKQINFYFSLSDFKFIYFWEWSHRLWARLMALAFAIPFLYFLIKGYFRRSMVFSLFILFLLGGLQGLLGWIMVKSGLNEENIYVSPIRLAIHFMAALGLLVYTVWFGLRLRIDGTLRHYDVRMKRRALFILLILLLQFVFGAFMAGLKAALAAPSWPMINDYWVPPLFKPDWYSDALVIHFIHRTLAYLLTIVTVYWWFTMRKQVLPPLLKRVTVLPLILVLLQVVFGVLTVLFSTVPDALLWLGTLHQFTAIVLLLSWVFILFLLSGSRLDSRVSV